MATRKFVVPSAEELNLAEEKQREESIRLFGGRDRRVEEAAASTSSDPFTDDIPAQPQQPAVNRETTLTECFANIRKTATHARIVEELKLNRPQAILDGDPGFQRPVQPLATVGSSSLLISYKQKGNPLIKFLRNVRVEYVDLVPDYVMGKTMCAIFLSLRYHNLYPNYIHERLKTLGRQYELRVLLVQVDTCDPHHSLKELTKIAILSDCTLMLAWSPDEAAKYLETYKILENKPADVLMKKQEADSYSKLIDALSSIKSINRTDAALLLSTFGTLENIIKASKEDFEVCPGMGPKKIKNLYAALHDPFLKPSSSSVKRL